MCVCVVEGGGQFFNEFCRHGYTAKISVVGEHPNKTKIILVWALNYDKIGWGSS